MTALRERTIQRLSVASLRQNGRRHGACTGAALAWHCIRGMLRQPTLREARDLRQRCNPKEHTARTALRHLAPCQTACHWRAGMAAYPPSLAPSKWPSCVSCMPLRESFPAHGKHLVLKACSVRCEHCATPPASSGTPVPLSGTVRSSFTSFLSCSQRRCMPNGGRPWRSGATRLALIGQLNGGYG